MSITISNQLFGKFECRMDDLRAAIAEGDMGDAQKMMERMMKAFVELRGTAAAAAPAPADDEKPAKKGGKTKLNADGTEKPKRASKPRDPNKPYSKLQAAVTVLYKDVSPEDKKALTANKFGYLVLCGYLNSLGKETLTADDMAAAVAYLKEHPEYKSKTTIQRSGKTSVASGEKEEGEEVEKKPRGRPAKKSEKPAEAAKESEKPAEMVKQIVAKLEAAIAESDDESDDEEEEESEDVPLESWDFKGDNYVKDDHNEVYTAEGQMRWLGTFNGKRIVKGDMPARVKKFLASMD